MWTPLGSRIRSPKLLTRDDITECLACGYSLRGALPGPTRCPECGMAYEQDMVAWVQHPPTARARILNVLWMTFIALLACWGASWLCTQRWLTGCMLASMAGLAALQSMSRRDWRFVLRHPFVPFVALAPGGVVLGWTGHPDSLRTLPWCDVIAELTKAPRLPNAVHAIRRHLTDIGHEPVAQEIRERLERWLRKLHEPTPAVTSDESAKPPQQ